MNGWIKLFRNIAEDEEIFLKEKFSVGQCWVDLLLMAQWKGKRMVYIRGNAIMLTRGQLAVSIRALAERWKMNKDTVQSKLAALEAAGRISIKRSRIINVITLTDYKEFIDPEMDENRTQNRTQTDEPAENPHTEPYTEQAEIRTQNRTLTLRKEKKEEEIFPPNPPEGEKEAEDKIFLSEFFADERRGSIEQLCMHWHITPEQLRSIAEECVAEWNLTGKDYKTGFQDLSRQLIAHMNSKRRYRQQDCSRQNRQNSTEDADIPNCVKTVEVEGRKIHLGIGEYIHPEGYRTYGNSGEHVPLGAPPRPSRYDWWQPSANQWCDNP